MIFLSLRKRLKHLLKVLGIATILLEVNPLTSEPLRLAVLIGTQAATHKIVISAVAFGGVTLVWELACVIAAADLLDGNLSKKIIDRTRRSIGKIGLSKLTQTKTSTLTDLATTLVLGSPTTIILKHIQDPERSAEDNRHLGYTLSMGAGIISTIQGAAIVAGLWHPSFLTDFAAVVIIGGSITAYHYTKRYLSTRA